MTKDQINKQISLLIELRGNLDVIESRKYYDLDLTDDQVQKFVGRSQIIESDIRSIVLSQDNESKEGE